jgi:hypothetical protein
MAGRPRSEHNVQLFVRVNEKLIQDIDEILVPHLAAKSPGVTITRSDAIRATLTAAIEEARASKPPSTKRPKK